jgi:cytochrome c2
MFKKVLLVFVALLVVAAPAMAIKKGIRNSAHDLSDSSSAAVRADTTKGVEFDRLCAWCHTPHYGRTDTEGPLWNRSFDFDVNSVALYNSATIEQATRDVLLVGGAANDELLASDAPLCLSCHDGTITGANDKLMNVPNGQDDPGAFTDATFLTQAMSQTAQIASDGLDNDHPIGMNYESVYSQEAASGDDGIHTLADATADGVIFYGAGAQIMWCSSCHDVHEPGTNTDGTYPFLITSNSGSFMCLACHNK